MIRRVLYGPPDWLVQRFSSRDRRAFGFWSLLLAAVFAIPFGRAVLYVTVLSVLALVPNFSSETPTETEDGDV